MGALGHCCNVIWHPAIAPSLEAEIPCTLINVHKLVSLLRITPTGKSCWWGLSYCHQTSLTLPPNLKWKDSHTHRHAGAHAHLSVDTHPSVCDSSQCICMCFCVCVMQSANGPVGVLQLAAGLHFMNTQWTSFISSFSSKKVQGQTWQCTAG